MALIGAAIKTLIDIRHDWKSGPGSPGESQANELTKLLKTAKDTAFGKYYGFAEMLDAENVVAAFQAEVPIFEYDRMNDRWWAQQQRKPDITWPGKPDYFALTSGTTSNESKRIPVTEDMLQSIRSVGILQLESLANFDFEPEFFEKDILFLSSSADLKEHNGHLEGEISGINASNLPFWTESFAKPGPDIAAIDDWDDRVKRIAHEAPDWDVCAMAGIPSWVLLMLKEIIKEHNLDTIHDLWPNLRVYATGGVAFGPYRESFDAISREPILFMDTYLASEGFFAYNARPDTDAMKLAVENGIFFEFIPFNDKGFDAEGNLLDDPEILTLAEVEEDTDYALIITTCSGAWRYMIGDTVKFTDVEKFEILISGRTKYFLNVVGSQLSEDKINTGIKKLSEALGLAINEFSVAAVKNEEGEYYHQWVLGSEEPFDEEKAAAILDEELARINKNYGVARKKALRGVRVMQVPDQRIYDWLEENKQKKGGQIKTPKVMTEEKMKDLLGFLQKG